MPRTIFPDVPVKDVQKTRAFWTGLGFAFDRALAAGAQPVKEPQNHGFMYQRSLEDLDGHLWELFHMDEAAFEEMTRSAQ